MTRDNFDLLGGLIDPLDYESYEIDSPPSLVKAGHLSKSKEKNESSESVWIKIKNPDLVALIVEAYVDQDKKKILNSLSDGPQTIPQILEMFNFEPTHGYRKIQSLIKLGLVRPAGLTIAQNRKKIKNYIAIIEDVSIQIGRNIENVAVRFKKNNNTI
jgi:hypothetical protein